MRPIHLVRLDKTRPALLLTRASVLDRLGRITVAPITSRIWGLPTEVPLGPANGIDQECVASLDNLQTVQRTDIGRQVGWLLDEQEADLARAIGYAFDLQSMGGIDT